MRLYSPELYSRAVLKMSFISLGFVPDCAKMRLYSPEPYSLAVLKVGFISLGLVPELC